MSAHRRPPADRRVVRNRDAGRARIRRSRNHLMGQLRLDLQRITPGGRKRRLQRRPLPVPAGTRRPPCQAQTRPRSGPHRSRARRRDRKTTGEVPPLPAVTASRLQALDLAAVIYTSHSHHPEPTSDTGLSCRLRRRRRPTSRHRRSSVIASAWPASSTGPNSTRQPVLPAVVSIRRGTPASDHRHSRRPDRAMAHRGRRGPPGRGKPHRR